MILDDLADFIYLTNFNNLSEKMVQDIKNRMIDSLGLCLAAKSEKLDAGVTELMNEWGGKADSSIFGTNFKMPAASAALVNGTLAHSLDFDDTHLPSVLHPSASVIPATIAQAQAVNASGKEVITAAALGLEICVRVGMGGYLKEEGNIFFNKGWHATSICGAIAAAGLASKLLKLDKKGICDAMSIAASMSSGIIEANRSGGSVKRLHCGWAAHSGIIAASLAKGGFTGPPTVFEGRFGFYNAFLDGQYDKNVITADLGKKWLTEDIFYKPYPANHYTHAGIDAALALKKEYNIDIDDIDDIKLYCPEDVLRTIAEPREDKINPESGYHAKFSGPFTIATALLGGGGLGVSFDDFTDEKAADKNILNLAAKVQTFSDKECDEIFPYQFPAKLHITMLDGKKYMKNILVNRGGPSNPLSNDELRFKFKINATKYLNEQEADNLATAIMTLDNEPNIDALIALTVPQSNS